jgi:hypothetical protein
MLEQRRAQEKGYITLKEAAELANYTPDYVGQLIRAGKIRGEQVYSNVAWVTTEDEINSYLQNKGRMVAAESNVTGVFAHQFFKFLLYMIIAAIAAVLLCLQYILYVSIDTKLNDFFVANATEVNDS